MEQNTAPIPSPFYALFDGAQKVSLSFACNKDGAGPYWDEKGNLDFSLNGQSEEEDVAIVRLGQGRYRLAEQCHGPFSMLRIHWGDEFIADEGADGGLHLQKLIVPRQFEHYRYIASGRMSHENPVARLVHLLGGGWESVATGLLTLSVPAEKKREFERRMQEVQLYLGIPLGDD